jgi:hypothetical protein
MSYKPVSGFLGNEEFSTNFNSLYASKLIVCIDESFIDKTIIKEKIKRLTTSDSINMEARHGKLLSNIQ